MWRDISKCLYIRFLCYEVQSLSYSRFCSEVDLLHEVLYLLPRGKYLNLVGMIGLVKECKMLEEWRRKQKLEWRTQWMFLVEALSEICTQVKILQASIGHIGHTQNNLKPFQKEIFSQNLIVSMINFPVLDVTFHVEATLLNQWVTMKKKQCLCIISSPLQRKKILHISHLAKLMDVYMIVR